MLGLDNAVEGTGVTHFLLELSLVSVLSALLSLLLTPF